MWAYRLDRHLFVHVFNVLLGLEVERARELILKSCGCGIFARSEALRQTVGLLGYRARSWT